MSRAEVLIWDVCSSLYTAKQVVQLLASSAGPLLTVILFSFLGNKWQVRSCVHDSTLPLRLLKMPCCCRFQNAELCSLWDWCSCYRPCWCCPCSMMTMPWALRARHWRESCPASQTRVWNQVLSLCVAG